MGSTARTAALLVAITTFVLPTAIVWGAGTQVPTSDLEAALLTVDDLLPVFQQTARASVDPSTTARPTGGPCDGPSNSGRALAIDPQVAVSGAVFKVETGAGSDASLNEDLWAFASSKEAKAFMKATKKQQAGCKEWQAVLGSESMPRAFKLSATSNPKLGDEALKIDQLVAPGPGVPVEAISASKRQLTFIRVGSVVVALNYLRTQAFTAKKPGPGYPGSAVDLLESTL